MAVKIGAGHPGGRVIEARAHDQFVVRNVAFTLDGQRLRAGVETRHPCLIVDVNALPRVGFLRRQEKPLEVGNLFTVDIGNTARAVPDVLELGVDDDIRGGVGALGGPGRADACGTATDHHDPLCHPCPLPTARERTFSIRDDSYTMMARASRNVKTCSLIMAVGSR